jgi:anti-anti-sigma factor
MSQKKDQGATLTATLEGEILSLSGALIFDTVQQEAESLHRRLHEWAKHASNDCLSLCLSQVSRVDSAGLALVIELKKRLSKHGHLMRIVRASTPLLSMMSFYGVQKFLSVEVLEEENHAVE